jgi:hypothetical protein
MPFYQTAADCYADYAKRMAARFAVPRDSCECCGSCEKLKTQTATWELRYQNGKTIILNLFGWVSLLFGHYLHSSVVLRFATRHRFCRRCSGRVHLRRTAMILVSLAATVCAAIALLGAGGMAIFVAMLCIIDGVVSREAVLWLSGWIAAAVILLPLKRRAALIEVPASIRHIAKNPIVLVGLE